jgi:antirestriction protein
MKIYAACLASYNAGRLHGAWIDVDADKDVMAAKVDAMLKASPMPNAEEFAIHDYDEFPNMGEYPSLDAIAATAELVELAEENGIDASDFAHIADNWHGNANDIRSAFDCFIGVRDSFEEYAEEMADECLLYDAPESLAMYFDYQAYARDIAHGYTVVDLDRGVAIFHH